MREPAWNKRISICSFSHAAILNVWSSHCPRAISPRQRRTRNHQPVPTLTLKLTRKDDAGAGIMLQSSIRSAALLVLAAGMAATSATAKPPGAPPAAHPAPAPHPAAARGPRAAPAPHAAPAARAAAPHIAAPRVAPQAPRAAAPRVTTAPRAAPPAHRVAPQQLARPSGAPAPAAAAGHGPAGHGPKERTVVAPTPEKRVGGRGGPGLAQPALRERPGRQPQSRATVRATAGRAAAGSIRSYRAGPGQIGPAGPGNATGNLQPNRCRPHLAQ